MSDRPMGPLFKPQGEGFFVFTNIGAATKQDGVTPFTDPNISNNTVQITGDVWEGLRMAQPEGTQELLDAKGLLVMAFENTSDGSPGTMNIDAEFVAKSLDGRIDGLHFAVERLHFRGDGG